MIFVSQFAEKFLKFVFVLASSFLYLRLESLLGFRYLFSVIS
jgi:hypothetical protein